MNSVMRIVCPFGLNMAFNSKSQEHNQTCKINHATTKMKIIVQIYQIIIIFHLRNSVIRNTSLKEIIH